MTEPTWTPWIENPGTGECPVPEWNKGYEILSLKEGPAYHVMVSPDVYDWSLLGEHDHFGVILEPITHYRYSIPADLAWLAENVSEWDDEPPGCCVEFTHVRMCPEQCVAIFGFGKGGYSTWYTKRQWLRARHDLGYESGEKVGVKDDNPPIPSKYHRQIKGVYVDVYDILHAFGITNPGDQHAIKKMLQPGKRGYKDARQDREEAIMSLERANELEADQ